MTDEHWQKPQKVLKYKIKKKQINSMKPHKLVSIVHVYIGSTCTSLQRRCSLVIRKNPIHTSQSRLTSCLENAILSATQRRFHGLLIRSFKYQLYETLSPRKPLLSATCLAAMYIGTFSSIMMMIRIIQIRARIWRNILTLNWSYI